MARKRKKVPKKGYRAAQKPKSISQLEKLKRLPKGKVRPPKLEGQRLPPDLGIQKVAPPPPVGSIAAAFLVEKARSNTKRRKTHKMTKKREALVVPREKPEMPKALTGEARRTTPYMVNFKEELKPRKPKKACPKHKFRYSLDGTPMCVHPDCMRSWIYQCGHSSRYIMNGIGYLHALSAFDDFVQFMLLRYIEGRIEGQTPMFRPLWVLFRLQEYFSRNSKFTKREMGYEEAVEKMFHSSAAMRDDDGQSATEIMEAHLTEVRDRWAQGVFRAVLYNQVHDRMVEDGFRLQLMAMRGDMTKYDLWLFRHESKAFLGDSVFAQMFGLEFAREWTRLWASHVEKYDGKKARWVA